MDEDLENLVTGLVLLIIVLFIIALVVLVVIPLFSCIVTCFSKCCKSEAVQVDAPAAAVIAPQSSDHRTDLSLTTSRTHPAVF